MSLTYGTVYDFMVMKDIRKSGIVVDLEEKGREVVKDYLEKATRYIEKNTRRSFYPWIEERVFEIPHAWNDLTMRRYPSAHLILDQDMLEIITVNTGAGIIDSSYYYPIEHNIKPHYGIAIKFPKSWGGSYGAVTGIRRYDEAVIKIKAVWGYAENSGGYRYPNDFWINTNGSINTDINASQTTITITSASTLMDNLNKKSFVEGRLIKIDEEFIEVTSSNATQITVLRGVRGSTPATHLNETPIYRWRVIEDIVSACLQVASIWREADIQVGGRLGVSDVSSGAELSIPTDPAKIIQTYQRSMLLE